MQINTGYRVDLWDEVSYIRSAMRTNECEVKSGLCENYPAAPVEVRMQGKPWAVVRMCDTCRREICRRAVVVDSARTPGEMALARVGTEELIGSSTRSADER